MDCLDGKSDILTDEEMLLFSETESEEEEIEKKKPKKISKINKYNGYY